MKVHIVCSGNTFRSRLAEAYLRSKLFEKRINDIDISSSGINAHHNSYGPIAWYTLRILHNEKLTEFMSPTWVKTTVDMIKNSDYVIFMKQMHLDHSKNVLGETPKDFVILDIEDVFPSEIYTKYNDYYEADLEIMKTTDEVFVNLKNKIDVFISKLIN
jgi:protein-tyrosine-phosphatase